MLDKKEDIKNLAVHRREFAFADSDEFVAAVVGLRRAGISLYLYHIIKSNRLRDDECLFVNFWVNYSVLVGGVLGFPVAFTVHLHLLSGVFTYPRPVPLIKAWARLTDAFRSLL